MTQIPCPNCGELLTCGEDGIGRRTRCPRCRVMLRLDADGEGRPTCEWPRRRFPLLRLAVVLIVFLAGLGIGFTWGRGTAGPAYNGGVSATAVGVFSASNNIVVDEKTVVAPPAKPARP